MNPPHPDPPPQWEEGIHQRVVLLPPSMGEGRDGGGETSQFLFIARQALITTATRCPVKRPAFFGAHTATIRFPHSNASKAKEVSVSIPGHKAALSATHDNSQQSRSSREIKRVFFVSFLFAIKKKEVGCRAETRRFLSLSNGLFRSDSQISRSQSQSRGRGPAAALLFVQAHKKKAKNGLLIAREFRLF